MLRYTIAMFIRFCMSQLVFGLLFLGLGAYGLLTLPQSTAADANLPFSSPLADLAHPLSWVALLTGAGMLVYGWIKAKRIQGGG